MRRRSQFNYSAVLLMLGALSTFGTLIVRATVPRLINFQGILKDANGQPVPDGSYPVKFEIYNSVGPGGGCLWEENQAVSTQGGQFAVILGTNSPVGIPDSAFDSPDRWLAITVGNDPEMSPRQRLVSVGYSFRVNSVDGATGGTISGDVSIQSELSVDGGIGAKAMALGIISPGPPQVTPFLIRGAPGQAANLMELQDNTGAPLISIDANGDMDGLNSTWESGLFIDVNCNALGVDGGSISLNGPLGSGSATLQPSGNGGASLLGAGGAGGSEGGSITIESSADGGNVLLEPGSSGNVGVGEGNPHSILHIGGALATAVTVVNSPTPSITLNASHSIILCNAVLGTIFVNLPTAVGIAGRQYTIKLIFSNFGSVSIDPAGNESIEGSATYSFSTQYKYATIVSDGANWWIIANN